MTTRSLGTLTLDLIAKIGGFTAGMTEAERAADAKQKAIAAKSRVHAKEVERAWSNTTRFMAGAFAGLSIAGLFAKFTKETIEAQDAQTQLTAVLRSTGNAAGFTQQQLNAMAAEMGDIVPNSEAVNQAQTALLKYTNVVGVQFVQALRLAADMSARTGEDLKSSADKVGKALNSPAEGLAKLRREGVAFSDAQADGIKALVETGRVAEAQGVILEGLERSYGGAARAARETFAGSLNALQEAINDLMTGDDDSVGAMREGIEELIKTLKSPEVKEGFATMLAGMAALIDFSARVVSGVVTMTRAVSESIARNLHGSADPLERLGEDITSLQGNIELLNKSLKGAPAEAGWVKETQLRIRELTNELNVAIKARDQLLRQANAQPPVAAPSAPKTSGVPTAADLEALGKAAKGREEAIKAAEQAIKAADAYIKRLREQLGVAQELTTVEKLRRDIAEGVIKPNQKQQDQLLLLAKQIDAEKAWQEEKKKSLELFKAEGEAFDERTKKVQQGREFAVDTIAAGDPVVQLQNELDKRKALLDEYAQNDLANQDLYIQARHALELQGQELITRALQDAAATREAIQKAERDRYINATTTFLDNLSSLQSSSSERIARIGKAAAIANAIVKTYEAATSAYASLAGIPYVGPYLGAAAAAAAIAAGMANVQAIRSTNYAGGRMGGGNVTAGNEYTVGELGPERFIPKQSGFIVPNQLLSSSGTGAQVNQRIINVIDPAMVGDFMATPAGEQVLINTIRRNSDSVRAVIGNG